MEGERQPWRLDKTINLPMVAAALGVCMSAVLWGKTIESSIDRERLRVTSLEVGQAQTRVEQGQIRTELAQQQSQNRLEILGELQRLQRDIRDEVKELRNAVNHRTRNAP